MEERKATAFGTAEKRRKVVLIMLFYFESLQAFAFSGMDEE